MLFSQATVAAVVAAGFTSAVPTMRRSVNVTDADILQYALTLEHLEDTFYREGLAKYSQDDFASAGFDDTVYDNLKTIASDEAAHVKFLREALRAAGANATAACTYDFGHHDVPSFLATASILEGVGVSAYLGAAAAILSKTYLTAAGSILTVESRHSAYLRATTTSRSRRSTPRQNKPFAQPFDTPLSPSEVYSLASAFIRACPPSNPKLPVTAFPALSAVSMNEDAANETMSSSSSSSVIRAGDEILLNTKASSLDKSTQIYAAFISVTGPVFARAIPFRTDSYSYSNSSSFKVTVPQGFAGQTYAVLTEGKDEVNDDVTVAGPAIIEVSA